MSLSRSARITLLLIIDIIFFLVELIVGYAVGSLALVADSFHMLNDVMSLIVALYAIKLSSTTSTDSRYSYGWHRAEILAALVNGVFLLALCFTISIEALQRFFTEPDISNPKLVVVVGSLGLASNILGLFLFHEHSHGHGHGHGHDHKHATSPPSTASPTPIASGATTPTQKTQSNLTRPIPKSTRSSGGHSHSHSYPQSTTPPHSPTRSRSHLTRRDRSPSVDSDFSLYGHPVATRASLVQAANEMALARSPEARESHMHGRRLSGSLMSPDARESVQSPGIVDERNHDETTPLLLSDPPSSSTPPKAQAPSPAPSAHTHAGHGHSHGSMNMHALMLHVMGDALGNVGVIATGLVIWLTDWKFKFYFDPAISLVITIIIFSSALPLVRSASFILLQGVPPTISLDTLRTSILSVRGVLSLHELHVWQLSESKLIASVHVLASRDCDFMPVAADIRQVFHLNGIHSVTIQPEYDTPPATLEGDGETNCLILCPRDDHCDPAENACCPPPPTEV